MEKWIPDTDIGSDSDDAMKLVKTVFTKNPDGNHIVLAEIDDDKFYDSYAAEMGFKWD